MQAVPPILPLLNKETGEVIERSPEKHAKLVRFQAELEVLSLLGGLEGIANDSSYNVLPIRCICRN